MRKILSIFLVMIQLSQPVFAERQAQDLVINADFQNRFKEYYETRNAVFLSGVTAGSQANEFISFLVTVQQKAKDSETKAIAEVLLEETGVKKLLNLYNKYYDLPSSRKYIEKKLEKLDLLKVIQRYQEVNKSQNKPSFMRRYPRLAINMVLFPIVLAFAEKEVAGTAASFKQLGLALMHNALKGGFFSYIENTLGKMSYIGSFVGSITKALGAAAVYYVGKEDRDILQQNLQGIMDKFLNRLIADTGLSFKEVVPELSEGIFSNDKLRKQLEAALTILKNYGQILVKTVTSNAVDSQNQGLNVLGEQHAQTLAQASGVVIAKGQERYSEAQLKPLGVLQSLVKLGRTMITNFSTDKTNGAQISLGNQNTELTADSPIAKDLDKTSRNIKELLTLRVNTKYELKYDDAEGKQVIVTYNDLMKGCGSALHSTREAILANLVKLGGVIALTSFLSSILYHVGNFGYDLLVLFQDRGHAPHNKRLNNEIYSALEGVYTKTPKTLESLQVKSKGNTPITLIVDVKKQPPKWRRWVMWGSVAVVGTAVLAYLAKSKLTALNTWHMTQGAMYDYTQYKSLGEMIMEASPPTSSAVPADNMTAPTTLMITEGSGEVIESSGDVSGLD
jgi:hypothetical protein